MNTLALFLLFVVTVIGLAIIAVFVACNSQRAQRLEDALEARKSIINAVALITLAIVVNLAIGAWGNALTQEQVKIEEREAAPLLTISENKDDSINTFSVENQKGFASYLTLSITERYTFYCNGESHEINVEFETKPEQDVLSISKGESASFIQDTKRFDSSEMRAALVFYLSQEYDVDAYVSIERHAELSFRDYNNSVATLDYLESNGTYRPITTDHRYIPDNNATYIYSNEGTEWQIAKSSLEKVMS